MRRRTDPLSDALKLLAQAHIAEYQGVTTRISRFMSVQFVVWPILVGVLSLITTTYKEGFLGPILFAWGSVAIAQVAVQTYNFALYEVYNHVRYVEIVLRPKLATIVGTDSFWGYERYLKNTGKANNPLLGDLGPTVMSVVALILVALWRRDSWEAWDFLGLAVNGLFLVGTSLSAWSLVNVRKAFVNAV